MPLLDKLKEELNIQKQLFFASIAVAIGTTGWMATNYQNIVFLLKVGCLAVIIFSSIFGYTRFKRMNQLLKEIEDA